MQNHWKVGQRVISKNEAEMGLAAVEEIYEKQIQVRFLSQNEIRLYNIDTPPIRRFLFEIGQELSFASGQKATIQSFSEDEGLYTFQTTEGTFSEDEVVEAQESRNSLKMFLSGHNTPFQEYRVRRNIWKAEEKYGQSHIKGLLGPRIKDVAHQFYIAQQLSKRSQIRALLSDEVGLGKTIEAGLVFSILKAQNRAKRCLIIVPEALSTQWLAEYYRKFSTLFSIIDESNWEEEMQTHDANPFEKNAFVICNFQFLESNPSAARAIHQVEWDLVIVDEVHRLVWNEDFVHPSWEICKRLSHQTEHLLLLSATPRKHGDAQLFGLLNLLDESQYHDFVEFLESRELQSEISQMAQNIFHSPESSFQANKSAVEKKYALPNSVQNNRQLVECLNDQYGLSRLHFHNRRSNFDNFPERSLKEAAFNNISKKMEWLWDLIENAPTHEKFLLICRDAKTAKNLYSEARERSGREFALFTEEMSLIERDRQAAWFVSPEHSVCLLICSEIGGEGRNFQCAQNLILWDLPENSDTLEQRIGRLDRIGQENTIKIHVPYLRGTSEEIYFRFFHDGLGSFLKFCPYADKIFLQTKDTLKKAIQGEVSLEALIEDVQRKIPNVKKVYEDSNDFLLDFNSFDGEISQEILDRISNWENQSYTEKSLIEIFDSFALDYDDFGLEQSYRIDPESLMFSDSFPGFSNDKNRSISFSKNIALQREDLEFISHESPFYLQCKEFFLGQHKGKCGLSLYHGDLDKTSSSSPFYVHLFFLAQSKIQNPFTHPIHLEVFVDSEGCIVEKSNLSFQSRKIAKFPETYIPKTLEKMASFLESCFEAANTQAETLLKNQIIQTCSHQNKYFELEIEKLNLKLAHAPKQFHHNIESNLKFWEKQKLQPESFHIELESFHVFLKQ